MEPMTITLKRLDKLNFEPPKKGTHEHNQLVQIINLCKEKYGDYVKLTFSPPYKPRTTGERSQNHKLNGMIMQICQATGNGYDAVKTAVKMMAVEQMGYPYEVFRGRITPKGERNCDTSECAKLIEAAYIIGAEYGIIFKEV